MYYLSTIDKRPEDFYPQLQGPIQLTIWFQCKENAEECLQQTKARANKYFGPYIAHGHPVWPETEIVAGQPVYEWSRIAFERLLRSPK